MRKLILFILFFEVWGLKPNVVLAQNTPVLNCPTANLIVADLTTNDPKFWNAPAFWDAMINSHDLAETEVPLSIQAIDACTTGALQLRYVLQLDLDHDGTPETKVDSDNLPPTNTIYYGNLNPHLGNGVATAFDLRPVDNTRKYRFALKVDHTNPLNVTGKILWVNQLGEEAIAPLPYGKHRVQWTATNGCGGQSTCTYSVEIKDDLSQKSIARVVCPSTYRANWVYWQPLMLPFFCNMPPIIFRLHK